MKKFLRRLLWIVLLLLGLLIYYKYYYTYSEGFRAGRLQKFSNKGFLFKTYEGEMILSSVRSAENVPLASEKFLFSVEEEPVARKVEQLQGEEVVVHYSEKNGLLPWRGDTRYIVDSISVRRENRGQ
ncbi:MAG: hypothetical protein LWW85_01375 [Marinilabiliales bacterium]|nr:hypothetical protein [Marinilabiliales bacterium]